jgi:PAS domain S-box-containing protein
MKLSTRMALAMVVLVLLTTGVLATLTYYNVMSQVLPRALDRLATHSRVAAMVFNGSLQGLRADALSIQAAPEIRSLGAMISAAHGIAAHGIAAHDAFGDHDAANELRTRIEKQFAAELAAKPEYALIRVIGAADGGLEQIRVDRLGPSGAIRIVPASGLTRRGDRGYFKVGMTMPPNSVHITKVELNRVEYGIEVPHVPTIRASAPLYTDDGKVFGVLAINVDLRAAIDRIRNAVDGGSDLYVVNEDGDYLVHPAPSKQFGFDLGQRYRIQDDFPGFARFLSSGEAGSQVIERRDGVKFGLGWDWTLLADGPRVAVVEARSYDVLMSVRSAVSNSTLIGGATAILCAIIMAIVVSRSLSRPLVQITRAVEEFGRGELVKVNPGGSSEIAVLTEALQRMTAEAQRKTSALNDEIGARSRLAEMLNNTIHNMADPVMITDANGRVVLANLAATKLFGKPTDIGNPRAYRSFDRFHPDAVTPLPFEEAPLLRAFRGDIVENFEFVVRPHDSGRDAYLIANGRPLVDETGTLQGVVMVYHDVTLTKKAEHELRESERMARAIIDTALDAFVQIDPAGNITQWSPQAETLFGWPHDEAIGQNLVQLIFSSDKHSGVTDRYRRFIESIDHGSLGYRIEVEANRRDGSPIQVEVAMTAMPRGDGYVMNAFFRDLTDKAIAEQQLRQAQKMESIGQLTGGIAHDFNNMLTVITGTIDILAASVADRPDCAAITRLISEAAERGAELTRHLLAFARKQPLQPCETDPNLVLSELQILLRPTLGEHIEIKQAFADDVWPIFVDRGQLEAALVNLAVNARDAMPQGGTLTLETSNVLIDKDFSRRYGEGEPGPYVMITVTDTGCGIPETIRARVFDPFFTTKEVGKGTGLGLSMVYGFIKQSGGHITLYSEVGNGTSFRVYLPRAKSETPQLPADQAQAANDLRGNETILIVEDDAMVRNYVTAQLKALGYTTVAAANAAAALELCDRGAAFDLLFTDIVMPGKVNGVQLAAEMANRRPGLKVLYTSGYSENAVIHGNRLDPDILLLTKPYRRSELARMIRLALATAAPIERKSAEVKHF